MLFLNRMDIGKFTRRFGGALGAITIGGSLAFMYNSRDISPAEKPAVVQQYENLDSDLKDMVSHERGDYYSKDIEYRNDKHRREENIANIIGGATVALFGVLLLAPYWAPLVHRFQEKYDSRSSRRIGSLG